MTDMRWKMRGATGLTVCLAALGANAPRVEAQGLWRGVHLAFPRRDHTATLLSDGRVALVGGNACRAPDEVGSTSAEILDPARSTTERLPNLETARREHTTSLVEGQRLVVAGGIVPPSHAGPMAATDSVEVLAKAGGSWRWEPGPKLLHARRAHAAVVLRDGRVVLIGGYGDDDVPLSSVEIWDPRRGGWKEGPALREPSAGVRAHLLPDGRVLMLSNRDHAEIWNPSSTQPWRTVKPPGLQESMGRALTTIELPDGRIAAVGPKTGDHTLSASVEIWNPKAEAWTTVTTMQDTGSGFGNPPWSALALSGSELVFVGPQTARALSPARATWRDLEPPLLPSFRARLTALPSGKMVLSGGHEGRCDLAEVWDPRAAPAGHWTRTTNGAEPLTVLESGQVLTISPPDRMQPGRPRTTRLWDPKTGKLGEPAIMGGARKRFAVARLPDDRVLVAGGIDEGRAIGDSFVGRRRPDVIDASILRSSEIYSPLDNRWIAAPALNEARESLTMVSLVAGRVLVLGGTYTMDVCRADVGGYRCGPRSGFERTSEETWQPGARSWRLTARPSSFQQGGAVIVLGDGRLFSAGGEPDGTRVATLDAQSDSWSPVASMTQSRAFHAAVGVGDGRVLVAGGVWAEGVRPSLAVERARTLASSEIWSSKTGKWTASGALNVGAYDARAVTLPDGRVMVTGMVGPQSQTATRPEIWDPRDERWTPTAALPEDAGPCAPLLLKSGEVLLGRYVWSPN